MRHLGSLLLGLVLAPAAWVLLAFGTAQLHPAADAVAYPYYVPIGCLAGAGLLLGLLTSIRISPVGAIVAGSAYLAYAICSYTVAGMPQLPSQWRVPTFGYPVALRTPTDNGSAVVLGAVLVLAVISVRRWRRWPAAAPPAAAPPAATDTPAVDTPVADIPAAVVPAPATPPAQVTPPTVVWPDEPKPQVPQPPAQGAPPKPVPQPAARPRPLALPAGPSKPEPPAERFNPAPPPERSQPAPPATVGPPRAAIAPPARSPLADTQPPPGPDPDPSNPSRWPTRPRHAAPEGALPPWTARRATAEERAADIERISAEQRADAERAGADVQPPPGATPWSAPPGQNPH